MDTVFQFYIMIASVCSHSVRINNVNKKKCMIKMEQCVKPNYMTWPKSFLEHKIHEKILKCLKKI